MPDIGGGWFIIIVFMQSVWNKDLKGQIRFRVLIIHLNIIEAKKYQFLFHHLQCPADVIKAEPTLACLHILSLYILQIHCNYFCLKLNSIAI